MGGGQFDPPPPWTFEGQERSSFIRWIGIYPLDKVIHSW